MIQCRVWTRSEKEEASKQKQKFGATSQFNEMGASPGFMAEPSNRWLLWVLLPFVAVASMCKMNEGEDDGIFWGALTLLLPNLPSRYMVELTDLLSRRRRARAIPAVSALRGS